MTTVPQRYRQTRQTNGRTDNINVQRRAVHYRYMHCVMSKCITTELPNRVLSSRS